MPSERSKRDSSFVVVQSSDRDIVIRKTETDSSVTFVSIRCAIRVNKFPLRVSFFDASGRLLLTEPESGGMSYDGDTRILRFIMDGDDHFYGTGERGNALDKRGKRFVSYNTQIGSYSDSLPTMNLNVPLITTANGYAVYIDNTYRGVFDFGATDPTQFSYTTEGGELSWYFIAGSSVPEQLERYTWLTGRQPLPPRWVFGFTQSKNRYVTEEETRGIVRTMREKHFPIDAIVLDLAWFKHMGDVSWDTVAWPGHRRMITDFLQQGVKTVMITEPYIVQTSHNFAEADKNGFLAKDSTGKTYLMEKWWSCGGCSASLLDLTDPMVRQWWWSKHPAAFGTEVAGIWTDLGEPEKHPESMRHFLGSAVKIHNIYNLLWAKLMFEGFSSIRPNERVVNLTRSGFAGIQRYGVLPWSGDVARSFGGLAVQLPMVLNMGMSGIAYHNSDIGGYARNPTTPELYVRWMQYGVFCPVTRTHGAGEVVKGSPTEPWQFGEEAERICREYLRLRYALLPYNYTLAYQNFSSGLPLARPLFWSDPSLTNESSTYLWGESFLVSPVVAAGKREQEVTLPKGKWFNYWTDEMLDGGRKVIIPAPLERLPLFVKAGSIIPMSPVMEYSDQFPLDTVFLHIYPDSSGSRGSSYSMYEDDGRSLDYQTGGFTVTTFTQHMTEGKDGVILHMSSSASGRNFKGKLNERNYLIEFHLVLSEPRAVSVNGVHCSKASGISRIRSSVNVFHYDRAAQRLRVHYKNRMDARNEVVVSGVQLRK
jgi:alpha-glucosidase (family GH31 glycosyl hydrolase)